MPYHEAAWAQFASEIGAELVKGSEFRLGPFRWKTGPDKVVAKVNQWTITLTAKEHRSQYQTWADTLIGAPYVHRNDFRFAIYREGLLSKLETALGMQDIKVGYPELDRDLFVQANDESGIRALLGNSKIRHLIQAQPRFDFEIMEMWEAHSNGFGGAEWVAGVYGPNDPWRVLLAKVEEPTIIADVERLSSLHELIAETLNQLCEIGSASEEDPATASYGEANELGLDDVDARY